MPPRDSNAIRSTARSFENVGIGSVVAIIGFVAEAFEGLRIGVPVVCISALLAITSFSLTLLFLRKTQRFHVAGHIVLATVLIAVSANLVVAGGFANSAIVALFILPIGAAVLISVPASVVWGTLSFAVLVGFWLLPHIGLDPGPLPKSVDAFNALINLAVVLGGIVIMISLFVTSQKRADVRIRTTVASLERQAAHLALLKEAAVAANEASTLHDAVSKCLNQICATKGWPLAHAYDVAASAADPSSMRSVLYVDERVANSEQRLVRDAFRLLADASADASNPELPPLGKRARWDSNLSESRNPYRRALARQLGLCDRVLVLIDIGDRNWILEFFSTEPLEPDEAFIDVLRNTGTQLGRVLERSRSRSRIHDLSYSDALTGLPNRRHLNESLETLLASEGRETELREGSGSGEETNKHIALLQVGIDRFQVINDALGHDVGDKLLRKVADRLLGVVASTTRSEISEPTSADRVFRVGGDEFAIVLGEVAAPTTAAVLAQRILDRLAEPMLISGREIFTTASLGISISGIDATEGLALLRCADSALAAAKKVGGHRLRFYAASLNEQSSRRLFVENRLRRAIKREELSLAYQPLIAADDDRIVAAEALLRWTTADGQKISPVEFIPVAESTGQIGELGRWVLERACAQLDQWRSKGSGPSRVAVNVSVEQLREGDFVEFVVGLIERFGLPPGALELEITESRLIGSEPEIFEHLEQLRDAGASLALDDFGTGYSSLSQLKRLPIEKLKIDRSFVDGIEEDPGKPRARRGRRPDWARARANHRRRGCRERRTGCDTSRSRGQRASGLSLLAPGPRRGSRDHLQGAAGAKAKADDSRHGASRLGRRRSD